MLARGVLEGVYRVDSKSGDIAGTDTAYTTTYKGEMRSGVFYRSNALTPKGDDLATLNNLAISTVIDVRSPAEVAAQADTLPDGIITDARSRAGGASHSSFH